MFTAWQPWFPFPVMVGPYRIIINHIYYFWCFSHFSMVVFEWICSCTQGARSGCKQGTPEAFISTFNQFILLFSSICERLWNGKKYLQETHVKARTYPNKEKLYANQTHKGNGIFMMLLVIQEQDQANSCNCATICRNLHFITFHTPFFLAT